MNQPKGHGLLIELPGPTDYVAGDGRLSGEVINPEGDWTQYVIDWEHQAPKYETNACASFGTIDALQALRKHFDGGTFNLSDRFTAKISGTDPKRGNTPQKVAQAIRDNWSCLEQDWPMTETVDDYYKSPPDLLYSKAEVVRDGNTFQYHAITNPTRDKLKEELKRGAVCMSVALMPDGDGIYYRPQGWRDAHWVWLLYIDEGGYYVIKDTYEPFTKMIQPSFIPEVAYRYNINEKQVDGILVAIRSIIKKLLAYISTVKVEPPAPKPTPVSVLRNTLVLAMQKHEGWFPGSRSQRNNNPLNTKYSSVGYLPMYGEVKRDPQNFAIFKDYETGFLYGKNLVLEKARKHPDWTLVQFIGDEIDGWAPASDNNNVQRYAQVLATAIKVDPVTWQLKSLL
jgi:hypothetical protein